MVLRGLPQRRSRRVTTRTGRGAESWSGGSKRCWTWTRLAVAGVASDSSVLGASVAAPGAGVVWFDFAGAEAVGRGRYSVSTSSTTSSNSSFQAVRTSSTMAAWGGSALFALTAAFGAGLEHVFERGPGGGDDGAGVGVSDLDAVLATHEVGAERELDRPGLGAHAVDIEAIAVVESELGDLRGGEASDALSGEAPRADLEGGHQGAAALGEVWGSLHGCRRRSFCAPITGRVRSRAIRRVVSFVMRPMWWTSASTSPSKASISSGGGVSLSGSMRGRLGSK